MPKEQEGVGLADWVLVLIDTGAGVEDVELMVAALLEGLPSGQVPSGRLRTTVPLEHVH
jgi:hypothetical protein